MPKHSKMCMPRPSASGSSSKTLNDKRKSNSSVRFKGQWSETRMSLHRKASAIFEESESSDEDYEPRRSMAPARISVADNLEVITSNTSFQEKMAERDEKTRNKSVFSKALRKTKVWVQEAVTGEPIFSDEDWEENLARETALERIKKKKDKEFRRSMIRKSTALGLDRNETADIIRANQDKPLRLTAAEVAAVEKETQRLVEISREEREEEEMVRRETKAIEKANKIPNRFSVAMKALVLGTETVAEEITRHPRFSSSENLYPSDSKRSEVRRPTKFNFNAPPASESEEEEDSEDEEESTSESESSESLTVEEVPEDSFRIEKEIFYQEPTPVRQKQQKPMPPVKEPSPDHTPRPQELFKNEVKRKSPKVSHTKLKKHKKNRKNISVEDLSLQCDLDNFEEMDYSIIEVNEVGCQFPSLCALNLPRVLSGDEDCVSLQTDDCSESIALPSFRAPLKNDYQDVFSPKNKPLKVELIPWAEEVWSKYINNNDLASPQKFLDKQSNRHDISNAIHQHVKVFQVPSNVNIPKPIDSETPKVLKSPVKSLHPEDTRLPETPINSQLQKNRQDSLITIDTQILLDLPINNDEEPSRLDDVDSLKFDDNNIGDATKTTKQQSSVQEPHRASELSIFR